MRREEDKYIQKIYNNPKCLNSNYAMLNVEKIRKNEIDRQHKYYEDNKEKIITRNLEYRKKHREDICEKSKEYAKLHSDQIKVYNKEYYEDNKNRILIIKIIFLNHQEPLIRKINLLSKIKLLKIFLVNLVNKLFLIMKL